MHIVLERRPEGIALIDDDGAETVVAEGSLVAAVGDREAAHPRWVWTDSAQWYPPLLAAGVRVERCHDLRLVDAIIAGIEGVAPRTDWRSAEPPSIRDTLFDFDAATDAAAGPRATDEWARQQARLAALAETHRVALLAAAESAGALAAVEICTRPDCRGARGSTTPF